MQSKGLTCLGCPIRKKNKFILSNYINDKIANEILGADRHQEYMWFTEMDECHNDTANIRNQIPANATKSTLENVIPSTLLSHVTTATTPNSTTTSTQDNKKKTQENIDIFVEHVVGNLGALFSSLHESTNILKNMDINFAVLLEKFYLLYFTITIIVYCN